MLPPHPEKCIKQSLCLLKRLLSLSQDCEVLLKWTYLFDRHVGSLSQRAFFDVGDMSVYHFLLFNRTDDRLMR